MAVYKIHKNNNYSVMSNVHFKDKNLSWKAKGILSTMFSLPEDWDYSAKGLESLSIDMETSLRSGLKELEENGYLERKKIRENGKIIDWEYNIYEIPLQVKPVVEKPVVEKSVVEKSVVEKSVVEKSVVEKSVVENQVQLNTYILSTDLLSTDILSTNKLSTNKLKENILKENDIGIIEFVFDYWNDCNIIKHLKLTEEIKTVISKALKDYNSNEIVIAIKNYNTMLKDLDYNFCKYEWSLINFLKQKNALPSFTNDGDKWVNYYKSKKERVTNNIYADNKNKLFNMNLNKQEVIKW